METENISAWLHTSHIGSALLTAVLALLCWALLKRVLSRLFTLLDKNGKTVKNSKRVLSFFKYLLVLLFASAILKGFGIDLSSVLAGVGLAGVVVGFAVQDVLKDITMGINILADKYYAVGDIVSIGTVKYAKVLNFNMKATQLQDLDTGAIITMANRNISQAAVLSDWQFIDLPAPYEESPERMDKLIRELCKKVEDSELVSACEYAGVQEFGEYAISYRIRVHGKKEQKGAIRRYTLACLQELYAQEGISIPYPHMVVVTKQEKDSAFE